MKNYLRLFILLVFPFLMTSQEQQNCTGGVYDLIKPFVGSWKEFTVTSDGEVFIGTLRSGIGPDGCTISQRFVSADGSFAYQSFGYVEAATGQWKEVYVFSNGNNSEYQWFKDDADVIMRRTAGTRKLDHMHQLRLTNIQANSYDVIEEHSYDHGVSWQDKELTRIKRED